MCAFPYPSLVATALLKTMLQLDPTNAEFRVFTYKEGLLSAVAHDLSLRVTDFNIEVAQNLSEIRANFDAASLRVLHAVKDGKPNPCLSQKDKRNIEETIRKTVLSTQRYPRISFVSKNIDNASIGWRIRGVLHLHGRERSTTINVRKQGDALVASTKLHQPDFGIKPYSAMMGTLRIQKDISIEFKVHTKHLPGLISKC